MVYFLGIGPGDPELVTVKAARIMGEADIIYVPQSNDQGRSVSEKIIAPYADKGKIRYAFVPMTKDAELLERQYSDLARQMAEEARAGKKVACVTLGDPMLYSTAQYVAERLAKLGAPHEFVPGITSYVASANRMAIPLAARRESMVVAPMPEDAQSVADMAYNNDTVVFMKINKRLPILLDFVREHKPRTAALVYRLGLDGEEVFDLAGAKNLPEAVGYLSTAIIKLNK